MRKALLILTWLSVTGFSSATDVSGPVSGTWTPAGNPYNLIDSTWVRAGQTLVIQPGVNVTWTTNGAALAVFGRLIAQGTPSDSIRMVNQPSSGMWLYLLGDSDTLRYVNFQGRIKLAGSGHYIQHVKLDYHSTGNSYGCGITGPASSVIVDRCSLSVYVYTGEYFYESTAAGVYQVGGVISNCAFSVTGVNTNTYEFSFAYAYGLQNCQASMFGNAILVNAYAGDFGSASGIENCSGLKRNNWIRGDANGFGNSESKGINNGNGMAINNTVSLNSLGHLGIGGSLLALNNVLYSSAGTGAGLSTIGEAKYNTIYGFTTPLQGISGDTLGNRVENPMISLTDGHLMPNSPCINRGAPQPRFNDSDGSRNDRGFNPFDPGSGANLRASHNSGDFGVVQTGDIRDRTVWFANIGLQPGQILAYSSSHPAFIVINGVPSASIAPGDSVPVSIRFAPSQQLDYTAQEISLTGSIPSYYLEVWGGATLPTEGPLSLEHQGRGLQLNSLNYHLPNNGMIKLELFDLLGRKISTLESGYRQTGNHAFHMEAQALPSGVYLLKLTASEGVLTEKVAIVR
jgi:hypothetical protein